MSSTTSSGALPTEALELGNPSAEYRANTTRTVLGGVVFLAAAALCAAVIVGAYSQGGFSTRAAVIMGILVAAFLGGAIWQFSLAIGNRNLRVVVLERGLARINGTRVDIIRWADVAAVYQKVTDHYRNGVKVNTSHIYTVNLENGGKLVFNDVLRDVASLGDTIQRQVSAILLPRSAERLSSGETLSFDKLAISGSGLTTATQTIPWPQVESVTISAGIITVRSGGKTVAAQPVSATPNLLVFLTLADRLKGGTTA